MNVEQVCRLLDNRMYHLLMFEGRPVKLRSDASACRQLYTKWQGDADYETFKHQLRFHFESGWLMVNVQKDYTPLVAGLATAAGLGAGYGLYRLHKNRKTETPVKREAVQAVIAKKSIADRISAKSELFPELGVVEQLVNEQTNDQETQEGAGSVVACPLMPVNWVDVQEGTRPAVFDHANNSCYFHASMLMLFQMRDWFITVIHSNQTPLFNGIRDLLLAMSKSDKISKAEVNDVYVKVQAMMDAIPNSQQDANEFLLYLLDRVNQDAINFQIKETQTRPTAETQVIIRSLKCNVKKVSERNVDIFEAYWNKLNTQQKDLRLYTVENQKIMPKDVSLPDFLNKYPNCTLSRGDPDVDDIMEKPAGETREHKPQISNILMVILRPDVQEICEHVASTFNSSQKSVVGLQPLGEDNALFNVKVLNVTTYIPKPQNLYYLVHLNYDPQKLSGNTFQYSDAAVQMQGVEYHLTCVIFRSGCGRDSGHYTAALKIGVVWIYYNDYPVSRTTINGNLSSVPGTPFMMLFKRVEQEEEGKDDP